MPPPLHPLNPSLSCFAACLTLIFQVFDTETLKLEQKFSSKRVTTVSLTFPDFSLALPIEREEFIRYTDRNSVDTEHP